MNSFPVWHKCVKNDYPENYKSLIEYTLKCSEFTPQVLVGFSDGTVKLLCRKRKITEADFKWVVGVMADDTPKVIKKHGDPIIWSFMPDSEYIKSLLK